MAWPLNKPHGSGTQNYIKIKTDDFHDDIDSRPGSGRGGAGGARPTYSAGHGPQNGNTGRNSYSSSGGEVGSGGAKHHGGYGGPSGSAHVLQALEARQAEQNSGLAHLDSSVTRLGELSLGISREIDLQNRMYVLLSCIGYEPCRHVLLS